MKNDKSKDQVELLGEYLRDRKPSHEEEQAVLDHVWKDLRPEGDRVPERVLRDFKPARTASAAGRLLGVGAAAALVFAVVLSGVFLRSDYPAIVETVDGTLERVTENGSLSIRTGEKLAFGEVIRSRSATSAVLTLNDGSEIEMRSNSALALEKADDGLRIRLNGGGVLVSAAKQLTGHLYVQTEDVTVSVVGTVFLVNAEEAGSRVAVLQGEVQVQRGTELRRLLRGEQVVTNPLMLAHPVVEQLAWSRSAEPYLTPLQQPKRLEFEEASLRQVQFPSGSFPTRVRCRGVDGELTVAGANAPPVPLGRCVGDSVPLLTLVMVAYGFSDTRLVSGVPSGLEGPIYQVNAKAEDPAKATKEELRQMLQNLLIDRMKMKVHRETSETNGYVLVVSKDGVRFKETTGDEEPPQARPSAGAPPPQFDVRLPMGVKGRFRLKNFTDFLSASARLPIIDKTELKGLYDIGFTFNLIVPSIPAGPGGRGAPSIPPPNSEFEFDPPLPKVLEEQLGLRLDRARVPVEYLVVDHFEKASEN